MKIKSPGELSLGLLRQDGKIYRKRQGYPAQPTGNPQKPAENREEQLLLKKNVVYYRKFAARLEQRAEKPSFRLQTNLGKRDGILLC